MKVYFESFDCLEDVVSNFNLSPEQLEGVEILYAIYDSADYEGWAQVIFRKDGKLYEVHGSHCSCYCLEDQWSPEETLVEALLMRPNVAEEVKEILRAL